MAGKREEQMKEITERLEQGVKEMFTSEKYMDYLKTMSQFHHYSFNNTLLIAMQKPEATLVAGFSAWQKKFNRQVKRGEKGIQIFAPIAVKQKEEVEKFDSITNEPILRPDGQPETEEVEQIIPRFRVATVFDISQTEGEPLPELEAPELMGSVENFEIFMKAIEMVSPVPLRYAEIEGTGKGLYSNTDKEIVIQEGMSESQTMKTGVHEVTHAMCHDRDLMEEAGEKKNRMTKEVEAESVAYTVCSYFGLDTSDYSFPYIAGWSSDMDMKELRFSMEFIRKTAGSFIDRMVENIQALSIEVHRDEVSFLESRQNRYAIYQIDEDGKGREYMFMGMKYLENKNQKAQYADYKMVYQDEWTENDSLDSLWERFNLNQPADFEGHSMSVSDVVAVRKDGKVTCYYVDSFGFSELPDFLTIQQQKVEKRQIPEESVNENDIELVTERTTGLEVDGHFGTWRTIEKREILGEPFFLMEEDDFGSSVASIIVNEHGELVAEDLENGFDSGAMEAINVYFMMKELRTVKESNPELFEKNKEELTVYKESFDFAKEHDEIPLYRQSREKNIACKEAIEKSINDNYDGWHLNPDTAFPILEEFGEERVSYVLAYTVQRKSQDQRFTSYNKVWADQFSFPDERQQDEFLIESHPAVLNGFIDLAKQEMTERSHEKTAEKPFISHYYVTGDASETAEKSNVQEFYELEQAFTAYAALPNHLNKQIGMVSTQEPTSKMVLLNCENGWEEVSHVIFDAPDQSWVRPEIQDIIGKAWKFVKEHDVEAAYKMEEEYLAVQTVQEGYDYTIYDQNFREIDGGILERPELSLKEIVDHIIDDMNPEFLVNNCQVLDYEEFQEKVEQVAQEELREKRREIEKEINSDSGQTKQEAKISFYVVECVEFPVLGEFHENLETLQEAMELYEKIPAERMNGIKGIGFCLEDGSMYDGNYDLMVAGKVQKEFVNEIPHYRDSPLVQKAIADIEVILSERAGRQVSGQLQNPIPQKTEEKAPQKDKNISGVSKKQSVLNALRERQARLKAQENGNQGQKTQAHKKGEQEL